MVMDELRRILTNVTTNMRDLAALHRQTIEKLAEEAERIDANFTLLQGRINDLTVRLARLEMRNDV